MQIYVRLNRDRDKKTEKSYQDKRDIRCFKRMNVDLVESRLFGLI